jgi:hypothetical protein
MIASIISQPLLSIPLAFASHFVCDTIPHFGINMKFGSKAMYTWLTVDGIAAVCFGLLLLFYGVASPLILFIAGFAAMSPDLAWLYYGLRGDHTKIHPHDYLSRFHSKIQWYQKVPGIYIELLWAALMIAVIIKVQ